MPVPRLVSLRPPSPAKAASTAAAWANIARHRAAPVLAAAAKPKPKDETSRETAAPAPELSRDQLLDLRDLWSLVHANGWTDEMSETELDALEAALLRRAVGAMPTADWMKLVRVVESRRRSRPPPEPPAGWRPSTRNDNRGPTDGW
jgi:hypothetical protein